MKVIIIEDEKPSARRLSRMLQAMHIEPITLLHSVAQAIDWLYNNEHPDLIMLDIQLSDGLSFEIFEEINVQSAIIFTTAYDEYALKAFKLNSIDYLLKPIDENELKTAIDKYKTLFETSKPTTNLDALKSLLENAQTNYKKRFTVKVGQRILIFASEAITCFFSKEKATYLCSNKRSYLLDNTLEEVEAQLNPSQFFRINRNAIIHIDAIENIVNHTNSRLQITLSNFDEIPLIVSRERVKNFKNWIAR